MPREKYQSSQNRSKSEKGHASEVSKRDRNQNNQSFSSDKESPDRDRSSER